VEDRDGAVKSLKGFVFSHGNLSEEELERCLYVYSGEEAVRHLFRVASSLDSMVIGEPQILGQVKDAYSRCVDQNASGIILNRLLHHAFRTAKRVRTETGYRQQRRLGGLRGRRAGEEDFRRPEG